MTAWSVTEASSTQREKLLEIEERLFGPESAVRARWLFDANPAGKALVLVAVSGSGGILGTRSLLPWKLLVNGTEVTVGQYARTWTLPESRHRGISVAIGEELNRRSKEMGYSLVFLFPSVRSIPGHRRIGNTLDTLLERRQVLLSPRLLWPRAPSFLDGGLRAGWKLTGWGARHGDVWVRELDPARAVKNIEGATSGEGVAGVRDAAFVFWRYSRDSGRGYEGWRYPGTGRPRFLAFTHKDGKRARILDFLGKGEPEEVARAVRSLADRLAGGMWVVEWCPSRFSGGPRAADRAGMVRRRRGVPLARWFNKNEEDLGALADLSRYRLTEGDSDYA